MPDDSENEETKTPTLRRLVVTAMGNDTLHKGMNWASIAGIAATAVLGYLSDARSTKVADSIAGEAATEIAVLDAWKAAAETQLAAQAEQIAKLREAVAALRAAEHAQHRQWRGDEVDELLDKSAEAGAGGTPAAPAAPDAAGVKRRLLGEP